MEMMSWLSAWSGKQVLVIGAARQGISLARFLALLGANVIVNDQRSPEQLAEARRALVNLPVTWACGGHPLVLLDGTDLVCPSGGVPLTIPLIVEAQRRGIPLSNDSQIFLEVCPCPTIGITGSAGKTTTTSLVGRMVAQALGEEHTWVGGNIGSPLLSVVDEIGPDDLAVLELSSFQLEIMTRSVHIAAVLNITPNHLDRHGSMEAYRQAKGRIVSQQTDEDSTVLGRDDPGAWSLAGEARGKVFSFGLQRPPAGERGAYLDGEQICLWDGQVARPVLPRRSITLRGEHNVQNVLAACAVADATGLPVEAMRAAIEGFEGVPHRLEWVRSWNGAAWYNDSIATAPERAMAAIRSFSEPIVLLAGGRDKKLPWEDFAALVHQRVDHLVLFGEAAGLVQRAVGPAVPSRRPYTLEMCENLEQAVQAAARVAEAGDVVLLSPGGTSFDEFRDFEARGEAYRQWVLELA
jgi:UDP-N-acetylmuramoylalanine--D-glutamate ligase